MPEHDLAYWRAEEAARLAKAQERRKARRALRAAEEAAVIEVPPIPSNPVPRPDAFDLAVDADDAPQATPLAGTHRAYPGHPRIETALCEHCGEAIWVDWVAGTTWEHMDTDAEECSDEPGTVGAYGASLREGPTGDGAGEDPPPGA